jgi:hypothetical protein
MVVLFFFSLRVNPLITKSNIIIRNVF